MFFKSQISNPNVKDKFKIILLFLDFEFFWKFGFCFWDFLILISSANYFIVKIFFLQSA